MKGTHSRRLAILTAALGLLVVIAYVAASWETLLEYWFITCLRSDDPEVRNRAIQVIEAHRSLRAVPHLLDVARQEATSREQALRTLEKLLPGARDGIQRSAAQVLLEMVAGESQGWGGVIPDELREDSVHPAALLHRVGSRMPGAMEVLIKEIQHARPPAFGISVRALMAALGSDPRGSYRVATEQLLSEADPRSVIAFFRAAAATGSFWDAYPSWSMPLPDAGRELAAWLVCQHPDVAVRAAALGFAIYQDRDRIDMRLLAEFGAKDVPLPLRRAAIRLTGYLGNRPGALDLGALLLSEREPELVADCIQARQFWSVRPQWEEGIDLGSGIACDWIPSPSSVPEEVPWHREELERLREILLTEKDGAIRDAASAALAARYRPQSNGWERKVDEAPFLEVHEWGVWKDGSDLLTVPRHVLDELPPFVHRSSASASRILETRSRSPMQVFKPVIFFRVREPLSLLVNVRFFEGRPWTYYPGVTDYLETTRLVSWFGGSTPPAAAGEFQDRAGISPPWELTSIPDGLYESVPWLIPAHAPFENLSGQGHIVLAGIGIEWCGLRVGHADGVEPDLERVDVDSWWQYLREVPSSSVAVRGERERFLFYDGAVNVPSPIIPAWEDPAGTALHLTVRSPGEYPSHEWIGWLPYPERQEKEARPLNGWMVPAAFVVQKREGSLVRGTARRRLSAKEPAVRVPIETLELQGEDLIAAFQGELVAQGLTEAEAVSLVRTWSHEFFEASGNRVITFLPRWMYDLAMPLAISPRPTSLVRVGLVLAECDGLAVARKQALAEPFVTTEGTVHIETRAFAFEEEPFTTGETKPFEIAAGGEFRGIPPGEAVLSRDGKKAVVRHEVDDHQEVFLLDLEKKVLTSAGTFGARKGQFSGSMWVSKDASRVAFRAFEDSTWDLFLLDVTGGRRVRLREPQGDFALSGDGTTLAVAMPTGSGTARIHLLHTEKEEERLVSVRWFESESANPESSLYSGLQLMTISRDGTRIAFMLSYALNRNDIYALDLAKGTFLNITGSKGNNSWPFLSEDGRYLVFSSDRHRDQDIFLFDMETRTMKHLMLSDFDEYPEGISAGGGRILFRRDRSHFVLDREGDRIIPIPGGKLDWGWPSLSRDGRWVLGSGVRERRVALFLHRLPD